MAKLELLAPAGNIERLKAAVRYGADAVYVGSTAFSLRNLADNFAPEELGEAMEACPGTRFVLCHLAYPRPLDTAGGREKWERMADLAKLPNCWLDVSAMPDFFGEEGWPYPTALALLRRVRDRVGIRKLIWGSDIPGTLCSAAYPQMMEMFRRADLTPAELEALFCRNAPEAYTLPAGKG